MKLLGVSNGEKVIASVARYDYVALGEGDQSIMMDGGILNLTDNGGCFRYRGKLTWLEVPQNLAELYNDWRESRRGKYRQYGIWNIEDIKILREDEAPDTSSFEWKAENAIWGTLGINGDQPLKYVMLKDCSVEHLKNIKTLCEAHRANGVIEIVDYFLNKKCKERYDHLDSRTQA